MLLKSATIQSYKCILDSGVVRIEPDITCFVGKNESGKTAFLESLYRLNPIPSGHRSTFKEMFDFPRHFRGTKPLSHASFKPLVTVFELDSKEVSELESIFGAGILASPEVKFSRSYGNELFIECEINEQAFVHNMTARANLSHLREDVNTVAQLRSRIGKIEPRSREIDTLYTNLLDFNLEEQIKSRLVTRLPKFYYFDEFSILPSRFSILHVLESPTGKLTKEEYTARTLMRIADIDTVDFAQSDYESKKVVLEAAARQITGEVFSYWSQNDRLRVDFDISFSTPDSSGKVDPYLDIRIWDEDHRISLKFNERSKGFIWFFSFLINFSELTQRKGNVIFLLDEPGLGLHPKAQQDLSRFITEKLSSKHQVIFTTHSPFMVYPKMLHKVRTVEDFPKIGTKFHHNIFLSNRETLMPIQASLGYHFFQSIPIEPNTIVVENSSDLVYLHALSDYLKTKNRTGLDETWSIIPGGNLKNTAIVTSLTNAENKPIILTNVKEGEKHDILTLAEQKLLDPEKLLLVTDFTSSSEAELEDMFEPDFYLSLLKKAGIANLKVNQLPPGIRIVDRVSKVIGKPIKKLEPALQLLHGNNELSDLNEPTLSRFETLFIKINSFLSMDHQASGLDN